MNVELTIELLVGFTGDSALRKNDVENANGLLSRFALGDFRVSHEHHSGNRIQEWITHFHMERQSVLSESFEGEFQLNARFRYGN